MENRTPFSSLENALRILKEFSMDQPELRLSEVADRLDIGRSTAHRLLQTLESEGFVRQNHKTNKYSLGVSVLKLTNTVVNQIRILKEAAPILKQLTEKTGESSHIGILEGKEIFYLHKEECSYPIKLLSHLGKTNPIHCTSLGQAFLAYQPDLLVDAILNTELTRYTQYTLTDSGLIRTKLEEIRAQGYAVSNQELHEGVISIGAPIFNNKKAVFASINIAGPVQRIKPRISYFIDQVVKASQQLSSEVSLRQRINQQKENSNEINR